MTREEFEETIEYKERKRIYSIWFKVWLTLIVIYLVIGIGTFISFAIHDIGIAFMVFISISVLCFLVTALPLNGFLNVKDEIEKIYNNINDMYEFEYTFSEPIQNAYNYSKYLVEFNYKEKDYKLMTSSIYDDTILDNKKVRVGYIESLDLVIVLKEI